MSSERVRFAYVGCGFVAQTIHIPNFHSLPNCHFLALAEARPELGKSIASRYGIPKVYKDHHEIGADPNIEAVGVSAPYSLQGAIAEDLIRAGKHVFMEKPMAVSLSRAESIVRAVRESKTQSRLMVAYMKRYDTGNILLKQRLDAWRRSGEVGRLMFARNHGFGGNWVYGKDPNVPFETSNVAPPPERDECPAWLPEKWKQAYVGYLQQWTHNINLLRWFLSDAQNRAPTTVKSVQLDSDGMTGIVVFDVNGHRAVVESGYTKFHAWEEHTQIYFEGGYLKTEAPPLMLKEVPATVEVYRSAKEGTPASLAREFAEPSWSYREEAKHFLANVKSGEPFRSSAEDTLEDVKVYEEIFRQFLKL